ncbi:hypothetical protein [Arthrobacter sp. UM1]|uniref:hypothetical protein n=1 Tax=Arthrobacter sp. UM1 TaxID=2766776 RepID=UPI001CF6DFBE|nr:hypothetical protein [Arthrobacter sp. UM1]MCB4207969.1 peptidase [Arthrobacter sp. UM1]
MTSDPASNRPVRRRNRHGRGAKGRMLPPQLRLRRHPMEPFSQMVGRAMGALPADVVERLDSVEVLSLNAPVADEHQPSPEDAAPLLGTADPARGRVLLYRWPLIMEARRARRPLKDVVADRLAYELSALWGEAPEQIDPRFGLPR